MSWDLGVNFTIAMLAIINPLGKVPLWLKGAGDEPRAVQWRLALLVTGTGGVILLICLLVGRAGLQFFGIDLASFRVGGGIVVLVIGIAMLRGEIPGMQVAKKKEESGPAQERARVRFRQVVVPLAIPMIAGPGSIITAIIYSSMARTFMDHAMLIGILGGLLVAIYTVILLGPLLQRLVGYTGLEIFTRLFGLLLAGIAAQFILEGLGQAFPSWIEPSSPINDDTQTVERTGAP